MPTTLWSVRTGRDRLDSQTRAALIAAARITFSRLGYARTTVAEEPKAIRDCHDQLVKLAAAGAIKPLVSERLGLADVIDGLERLAAGATIGRLTFLP